MRSIVARTMSGNGTYVDVVISPATHARPVVTSVSHATRALGSSAMMASRIASEIASGTLSGWPSVTDSEVKRWRSYTRCRSEGKRASSTLDHANGQGNLACLPQLRSGREWVPAEESFVVQQAREPLAQKLLGFRGRASAFGGGGCDGCLCRRDAPDDALHQRHGTRRDAQLSHAKADEREGHQ